MSTGELIITPPDQLLQSKRRAARQSRTSRLRGTIAGHLWTIVSSLLNSARPLAGPPARDFYTAVEDTLIGKVRLTGLFSDIAESDTLVLIVHGLAGNARSPYCTLAAQAAYDAGYASLRLSMRGADFSGEDIFHGGLTD